MSQIRVLLDTNIWIRERLLRSALGAAALHSFKTLDIKILLPDVARDEVAARIVTVGTKSVSNVQNELSTLQAITGAKPNITLPVARDFETAVRQRWAELEALLEQIDVQPALMRGALRRVIKHRPPGGDKEQFRDAVLWEIAIDRAVQNDVRLVTHDTDFGANDTLHPELAAEVCNGRTLKLHSSLGSLLRSLSPTMPVLDSEFVSKQILVETSRYIDHIRREPVFIVRDEPEVTLDPFLTERLGILAIKFTYKFDAQRRVDLSVPGELILVGECMYSTDTRSVFDVRPDFIAFRSARESGNIVAFGYADALSEQMKVIPYRVRRAISELQSTE